MFSCPCSTGCNGGGGGARAAELAFQKLVPVPYCCSIVVKQAAEEHVRHSRLPLAARSRAPLVVELS